MLWFVLLHFVLIYKIHVRYLKSMFSNTILLLGFFLITEQQKSVVTFRYLVEIADLA